MPFPQSKPWGRTEPPPGSQVDWGDPISKGLIGCWLCNEGAGALLRDLAHANPGRTGGSGGFPLWKQTLLGPALQITGNTVYWRMPLDPPAVVFNVPAMTVSVRANAIAFTNDYASVAAKHAGGTYFVLTTRTTGKLALYLFASANVSYDGTGVTTLSTGKWYRLTMTYDSVHGLAGYVDTVLDGTAAANGTITAINAPMEIGTDFDTGTRWWNGYIKDVRIWNRAISHAEVIRLCNEPYAGIYVPRSKVISTAGIANVSIPVAMHQYRRLRAA